MLEEFILIPKDCIIFVGIVEWKKKKKLASTRNKHRSRLFLVHKKKTSLH
jgi:hypothetical protein